MKNKISVISSSVVRNLPAHAGDVSLIPGLEDPLEKEMATHSGILALENSMDRGAWQATVHEVAKSQTQLATKHRPMNGLPRWN